MRVLITGASGQVGREFAEFCTKAGDEVLAFDHTALDVSDRDAVLGIAATTKPDVVLHAAAWTAVDACEADVDRAFLVNGLGTRHVAEAASRTGAHLVYLSTDYVFDGHKPTAYNEWDKPNPQSVYGRSKRAGELEVGDLCVSGWTIVRVSWVCGRYGNNMVKTLLRLGADGVNPSFVTDQVGCPTIVGDLVPVLRRLALEHRSGIFHITNQGAVSWYELAAQVFEFAGFDADRVTPISTAELNPPRPAPRPPNSVLDNAVLRISGLPLLPDHRESVARLVQVLQTECR